VVFVVACSIDGFSLVCADKQVAEISKYGISKGI